jgi:hypothetical protein
MPPPPRKRRLSQQDLRAAGVTPGLMAHKVGPDGRARLEQLTAAAEVARTDWTGRAA